MASARVSAAKEEGAFGYRLSNGGDGAMAGDEYSDSEAADLGQMKRVVREIAVREEALVAKARILQALACGAGEEVKLVSNVLHHVRLGKRRAEEKQGQQEGAIAGLVRTRDELTATVAELRDELARRGSEAEVLRAEAAARGKAAEDLRAERDELAAANGDLRAELAAREEAVSDAAIVRGELIATVSALEEEVGEGERRRRELELGHRDALGGVRRQLDESEAKLRAFEAGSTSRLRELEHRDALYSKWLNHLVAASRDARAATESSKGLVLGLHREWTDWAGTLGVQIAEMGRQAEGYQKLVSENRRLYNEVLDLKGNIRVYCRVRPSLGGALVGGLHRSTVDYIGGNGDIMVVNPNKPGRDSRRIFNFHKVFGSAASQEDVYTDTQPLIRSVLDGYNVCIFAYGQTGSGKTYTMSGPQGHEKTDLGVNYRALNDLFMLTESRRDAFQYEMGVQMIEIYNEQVRDLLSTPGSTMRKLEIRNHHAQLNVPDASLMSVRSKDDVLELMEIGGGNRAVGATAINERSSRSHSVLTVHVQGADLGSGALLRGCLHLVDLAGSERIEKSEATGERLKEALHINKSLSALGDVIAALALKSAHVPYRNSKLTQLLQESLGGQGKALMVVHITEDTESFGETISTLKFAERVATVELGAARVNREPGEIRELKEQIAGLKDVIAQRELEAERWRSAVLEDTPSRTPTKVKRALGSSVGLVPRRLSTKDTVPGRRNRPSPEGRWAGLVTLRAPSWGYYPGS